MFGKAMWFLQDLTNYNLIILQDYLKSVLIFQFQLPFQAKMGRRWSPVLYKEIWWSKISTNSIILRLWRGKYMYISVHSIHTMYTHINIMEMYIHVHVTYIEGRQSNCIKEGLKIIFRICLELVSTYSF